ncbi:MAG: hypothetical protein ABWZ25_16580 [Chitinophagaceae bacterium]
MSYFVLALFLFSCTPEEQEAPVTELPFFFIGTVNGQTIGFAAGSTQGLAYENTVFEQTEQINADSFHVYQGTRIFDQATAPAGSVTISLMGIFNHLPSVQETDSLFTTGYHRYALSDSAGQGGASILFVDGNGTSWSSSNHLQSDTSFRIELINPVTDPSARAIFQARFSCRLFNAAGDSLNLENGSVRGKILKP